MTAGQSGRLCSGHFETCLSVCLSIALNSVTDWSLCTVCMLHATYEFRVIHMLRTWSTWFSQRTIASFFFPLNRGYQDHLTHHLWCEVTGIRISSLVFQSLATLARLLSHQRSLLQSETPNRHRPNGNPAVEEWMVHIFRHCAIQHWTLLFLSQARAKGKIDDQIPIVVRYLVQAPGTVNKMYSINNKDTTGL